VHLTQQEQYLADTDRPDAATGFNVRLLSLVLFFVAIVCTYVQWSLRHFRSFKIEDSGLFLYIGQRLLHGDILYRDIADNKPPLIYWVNEFGLRLGHGSPAGVFVLSVLAGVLTFAILYWGLKQYVEWPLFIIAGCLAQLEFIRCALHPNYTESFALPLVALAAVLFVREYLSDKAVPGYALAQGVSAVLLFSFRPNNVGVTIIYVAYLLFELRNRRSVRQFLFFAIGAAATYGLVLLPLVAQGTLQDYVTNVFRLAAPYTSGTTSVARVRALWHGLALFDTSPLLYFSLPCAASVVMLGPRSRRGGLLLWLGVWVVLEMIMSSTSGYHWEHYYLLWIIPLAVILMVAGSSLFEHGSPPIFPVLLATILMIVMLNEAAINAYRAWTYVRLEDPALAIASPYIHPGDRVTTWGYFYHDLWFDLDHPSGTRWFHEGAFTNRKIYLALMPMFLSDLARDRPRVVIEKRTVLPLFAPARPTEPLNEAFSPQYFEGWDDAGILQQKAELAQRYYPVSEKSGVVVYLRRE